MSRIQPMGKSRSFVKKPAQQAVSYSTGRYYPGQELYGIAFSYYNRDMSSCNLPMLYDDTSPSKIHLIKLTVTEHHKVPNQWDESCPPKLNCDGYILVDDNGRRFTNQWPRASYGQLSDSGDRHFIEDVKIDFDERFKTVKDDPIEYRLLTDIFADICGGIRVLKRDMTDGRVGKQLVSTVEMKIRALEKVRDDISKKFSDLSGGKVLYVKKKYRWNILVGKIADDKRQAWADQYAPVHSKRALVEAVKKVKRYVVDHRVRMKPGFYTRFYSRDTTGVIHDTNYFIGGFQSRKEMKRGRHSKAKWSFQYKGRYRSIHTDGMFKQDLHDSRGCYITDMAQSGILIASSAALQNLKKEFVRCGATGFELGVLFKGWPDTQERFVEYMLDQQDAKYREEMDAEMYRHY